LCSVPGCMWCMVLDMRMQTHSCSHSCKALGRWCLCVGRREGRSVANSVGAGCSTLHSIQETTHPISAMQPCCISLTNHV
jgi:hypothetical protein